MEILVEKYGFEVKRTHLEYINEEFTIEVVKVGETYIVRIEQSARFNPSSVYYKLFEEVGEIVGFIEKIFEDYCVTKIY